MVLSNRSRASFRVVLAGMASSVTDHSPDPTSLPGKRAA
jgi:hypothetical protein